MKQNYGFKSPKIERDHHLMGDGRFAGEVLQEDGQWDANLPDLEIQRNAWIDSMTCWVYGTLNALETLMKRLWQGKWNYAERFHSVLANGSPNGGSPHEGCESIRKNGNIPQEMLPFDDSIRTFWQFSSPRPMTESLKQVGRDWLKSYVFFHDWVTTYGNRSLSNVISSLFQKPLAGSMQDKMKDALKYSPLAVSVYAWTYNSNGIAINRNFYNNNHWVMCYGFVDGQYWKIYDHYNKCFVRCEWNYAFGYVKRFGITKTEYAEMTPEDIKNNYFAKAVKGDQRGTIYIIGDGQKKGFKSWFDYLVFCLEYKMDPQGFITVPQKAIDAIPEGSPQDITQLESWKMLSLLKSPDNMKRLNQLLSQTLGRTVNY